MSKTEAVETKEEKWDLEKIKSYDDSWWLKYLEENTVFAAEQIKAQKEWLIEQAEQVLELETIEIGQMVVINGLRNKNKRLHEALKTILTPEAYGEFKKVGVGAIKPKEWVVAVKEDNACAMCGGRQVEEAGDYCDNCEDETD